MAHIVPFTIGTLEFRHSMRLKAYRRAEQDVEYLELLRSKLGLTPGQLRAFIDCHVDVAGRTELRHAEDAGTARYGRLSPEAFRRLREAAAAHPTTRPPMKMAMIQPMR